MLNELLLIGSILLIFGMVLVAYRLFGRIGLYVMTVVATILANIEVLLLVDAFMMEQTLGNVTFACTYLITDILSENEGKKYANKSVWIGIFTSVVTLIFTQYWLLYQTSPNDWAGEHVSAIFSTTPRLLLASFLGYAISQKFDVWLYHKWWEFTSKKFGDNQRFLWLRNNGSTMISQILNTVIFTLVAFAGWYSTTTLLSVMLSSYLIYFVTSLVDTPFVYFARKMKQKMLIPEE